MARGQASGVAREYEVLARAIIGSIRKGQGRQLVPLGADGVGVPLTAGGTTWVFDIALGSLDGRPLLLGECRRWNKPQEQEQIAAFAWRVHVVRQQWGDEIEAIYFTTDKFRDGALGAAKYGGVSLAVLSATATATDFDLRWYYRNDEGVRRTRLDAGRSISSAIEHSVTVTATVQHNRQIG